MEAPTLVRRHRPDYMIVLCMGLLMLLGLIIMYAIGPQRAQVLNQSYGYDYSASYFALRQAISIGMAVAAFIAVSLIPLKTIIKWSGRAMAIGLAACLLLFIADKLGLPIAQETLGATRWLNLGPVTVQPSEILKLGVLLYAAAFLGSKYRQGKLNSWSDTLLPLGVIIGVALVVIVVLQRDLGTGLALMAIVATMLFVVGISKRIGLTLAAGALALGVMFIIAAPYRLARVMTFMQGDSGVMTAASYHTEHAKIAIGSGGMTGLGIGNSVESTGYLPEAINDSVFAIIGEMFGFVGLIVVIALLGTLMFRLLKVTDKTRDMRLRLMAAGVFGWLAAHAVLNVGAMIGLVPLAGITLPLLSYGGTSMLFIAAGLGLVFQLSKYTERGDVREEAKDANSQRGRRVRRTRYASRGSTA